MNLFLNCKKKKKKKKRKNCVFFLILLNIQVVYVTGVWDCVVMDSG